MPSHLKHLVTARMQKTGETYQQALRHIRANEAAAEGSGDEREARRSRARTIADTAFSVTTVRAEEGPRPPSERLFEDPYAQLFARAGASIETSSARFLELPFFRDGVRLRTRFVDDAVQAGLAAGLQQLVLLGAGFDMRGWRLPGLGERGTRVYEVDTTEQLARKRRVLAEAGERAPDRIAYVPFDFHDMDIERALGPILAKKGFMRGEGAVFVWEGVVGYVTHEEIDRSLRFMADVGGPGSRVVFTFGENTFEPETAAVRARRAGFSTSCEELAGDELWRRYLDGPPHPHAHAMRVAVAIA